MRYFLFVLALFFLFFTVSCTDNFDRDYQSNSQPSPTVTDNNSSHSDDANTTQNNDFHSIQDTGAIVDNGTNVSQDTDTIPDNTEVPDTAEQPICGNNKIENGEQCDGNAQQCSNLLGTDYEGTANCKSDCTGFDTSTCTKHQTKIVYHVIASRCNGCRKCLGACSEGAISMVNGKAVIDPKKCTGCGDCVSSCRRNAIEKTTY